MRISPRLPQLLTFHTALPVTYGPTSRGLALFRISHNLASPGSPLNTMTISLKLMPERLVISPSQFLPTRPACKLAQIQLCSSWGSEDTIGGLRGSVIVMPIFYHRTPSWSLEYLFCAGVALGLLFIFCYQIIN
jgi:hypothetical protein